MASAPRAPDRPFWARPVAWVAAAGVLGLALLILLDWRAARRTVAVAPAPVPATSPAPPANPPRATSAPTPAPAQVVPAPPAPAFDIVRVAPNGQAVMAGRASPGAEVTVQDAGRTLGQTRADSRGNWVLTPETPLPPGARELSLAARDPAGQESRAAGNVLLVVPERAAPAAPAPGPLAVLTAPGAAPRVLQGPDAPAPRGAARLGLEAVDYDEQGEIRFAGRAPPGAPVRVYVDNAPAGDARADAEGRWQLTPNTPVAAGERRLRLDQIGASGQVAERLELPFRREARASQALEEGRVVVQPGQSLWVIARRAYGQGVRYTVIYAANRDQIRDPRLIYPGQTFALPPAPETARP